jgi:hypothetical protein
MCLIYGSATIIEASSSIVIKYIMKNQVLAIAFASETGYLCFVDEEIKTLWCGE